ncbi:uncharacterized protein BBOV_IV002960 [Babesia bovis T2Bo]|uniref:Uncharacterized protein n=1 Tax=Babesia bovis TaxID=5865 RepID=A7AVR7_BABBO|nr:uncharacterized protein BBOV_IV002960 [Babesia bovis T2Bo]EDO05893.1 hypothetical protein BBOV_IV002960 [Babesia bovis T2Bo]|eukprot:XP_001609461.1 hypothetical protein [Babesia bovis T2Bo]
MEVHVICDCTECSSRLIEIGGVNILCNLPTKLLHKCYKELEDNPFCEGEHHWSQELYDKLLCVRIHIIIATTPRGLDGLETLRKISDIETAYIVCTRPVYTIARLAIPKRYNEPPILVLDNKNQVNVRKTATHQNGIHTDPQTTEQCNVIQDLGNEDNVHVAWKDVTSDAASSDDTLETIESDNDVEQSQSETTGGNPSSSQSKYHQANDKYNKRSDDAFKPSIYGRKKNATPILADPNLPNTKRLHAISYNEIVNLEVDMNAENIHRHPEVKTPKHNRFSHVTSIKLCAYSSGFGLGSSNWTITHPDSDVTIGIIGETGYENSGRFCTPVDMSFIHILDVVILLDNAVAKTGVTPKIELKIKKELKMHQNTMIGYQLDALCDNALEGIQNLEGSVIVIDPYTETLIDLIEHLHNHVHNNVKQQVCIYVIGTGMVDTLNFTDKCAEWVQKTRAELTMHHETPMSPFPIITTMREENKLFVCNNINDIKDVYRYPSLIITKYDAFMEPYLLGRMYAGAHIVTTSDTYREALMSAAAKYGIDHNINTMPVDFRMGLETMIGMICDKRFIVVSEYIKSKIHPSLKVLVGNHVKIPLQKEHSLMCTKVKASDIQKASENVQTVTTTLKASNVNIKVNGSDNMQINPGVPENEDSKFTFGTFKAQQLVKQLVNAGFTNSKIQTTDANYPLVIEVDNECKVILQSMHETCVDTASMQKRQVIVKALEQLLVTL